MIVVCEPSSLGLSLCASVALKLAVRLGMEFELALGLGSQVPIRRSSPQRPCRGSCPRFHIAVRPPIGYPSRGSGRAQYGESPAHRAQSYSSSQLSSGPQFSQVKRKLHHLQCKQWARSRRDGRRLAGDNRGRFLVSQAQWRRRAGEVGLQDVRTNIAYLRCV